MSSISLLSRTRVYMQPVKQVQQRHPRLDQGSQVSVPVHLGKPVGGEHGEGKELEHLHVENVVSTPYTNTEAPGQAGMGRGAPTLPGCQNGVVSSNGSNLSGLSWLKS
jgi:hypothetical protein